MTSLLGTCRRGRDSDSGYSSGSDFSGGCEDPEYDADGFENLGSDSTGVRTRAKHTHFVKLHIQYGDGSQLATIGNRTPFRNIFGTSELAAKLGELFTVRGRGPLV